MQSGTRVLTESEWDLFADGADSLFDLLSQDFSGDEDEGWETGVEVFDRLTSSQKIILLANTLHALRVSDVPAPRHTAANEGTIAAVFTQIDMLIDMEIDDTEDVLADEDSSRKKLLEILATGGDDIDLLPPTSRDREEWSFLLECFENRVLWDNDWADPDGSMDLAPEHASFVHETMNIDREYYRTVVPDPSEDEVIQARQLLARLLDRPIPDECGMFIVVEDLFHGIEIGPIDPERVAEWEDRPWLRVIFGRSPGADCDIEEWSHLFGRDLPAEEMAIAGSMQDETGQLPPDVQCVQEGPGWVIRDERGMVWCDHMSLAWTDDPPDDFPEYVFPASKDAIAAFLQAHRFQSEQQKRRRIAEAEINKHREEIDLV